MGGVVRTKEVYIIMWISSLTLDANAERVTVVCLYVCPHTLFWQYAQIEV